ncbi:SMP-30/gluconolactonase/LRE family protein [Granulicella sp. WH15]|uniref:SMP-30/gluconolactonase/LRE family protein n=1 Tax=Granulicella sp. WH15 TaxID=2602070 RepID=UPI00136682D9|nr:SMP-30/gluconolactonase/LRE family protein [Granulicella sp. WH15]QHN03502.1 SMP-30/gluconolactonase/LRE family protein [Granulicella sp. WH15]
MTLLLALPLAAQQKAPEPRFELKAEDPGFWKLFDRGATLNTMGKDFGFTEGPVWEPTGSLLVSDETKNWIYRIYPDGHRDELIQLGDPDGSTFDREHRLLVTASVLRAIIRLSPDMKTYDVLVDRYNGQRLNSPNDVTLGPDGAIYFTDPTLDLVKGEKQETPFQGVYRLDAKGNISLLTKDLQQPNGLAFSPDGKFLYIDDTAQKNIRRYRFHKGALSDGTIFADENVLGSDGVPDGMKTDKKGDLYVTGPGGVWVWSPTGKHLGTVLLPHQPANLTWGDAKNSTLFLTAGHFVYTLPTKVQGHLSYPAKAVRP